MTNYPLNKDVINKSGISKYQYLAAIEVLDKVRKAVVWDEDNGSEDVIGYFAGAAICLEALAEEQELLKLKENKS